MLEVYKIVFQQVYQLTVISVTIPVSSAVCERTFFCSRRLKTYIRNKMTVERLDHLAIIHIEHSTAKALNTDEIINKFDDSHKNRKIALH
jgi:hypothetical protein